MCPAYMDPQSMDHRLLDLVLEHVPEPAAAEALTAWIARIREWNRRIDLTAARDDRELVDLMVADAVELARAIEQRGATVVDVGSGAGAPGLPLAMLRPDLSLTLVEPLQKRAALLRIVAASMKDRVQVCQSRVEGLHARFDVAISRATFPPDRWLACGVRLAPQIYVLLARDEPPRLDTVELHTDVRYTWRLTGAQRRLASYRLLDGM